MLFRVSEFPQDHKSLGEKDGATEHFKTISITQLVAKSRRKIVFVSLGAKMCSTLLGEEEEEKKIKDNFRTLKNAHYLLFYFFLYR